MSREGAALRMYTHAPWKNVLFVTSLSNLFLQTALAQFAHGLQKVLAENQTGRIKLEQFREYRLILVSFMVRTRDVSYPEAGEIVSYLFTCLLIQNRPYPFGAQDFDSVSRAGYASQRGVCWSPLFLIDVTVSTQVRATHARRARRRLEQFLEVSIHG